MDDDLLEPLEVPAESAGGEPARTRKPLLPTLVSLGALMVALATAVLVGSDQRDNEPESASSVAQQARAAAEIDKLEARLAKMESTVVSLQYRSVRVPNVVGLNVLEAADLLGLAGFGTAAAPPAGGLDVDPECVVTAQSPDRGSMEPIGASVRLSIAPPPTSPSIHCT